MTGERGHFILLEGPDGSGKTTVAGRLEEELGGRGMEIVRVREPGGTPAGEMIRKVLLDKAAGNLTPITETLLFYAARAQLVHEVLSPALESGAVVIADRFELSTWVYQAWAGDLSLETVKAIGRFATGGLHPDICIVLDVETEAGLARKRRDSAPDRMESKTLEYHRRLREGYLALAKETPYPCVVIDAGRDRESVFTDVLREIEGVVG